MPISNPKVIQSRAQGSQNFLQGWQLGSNMVKAAQQIRLEKDRLEEEKRQINLQAKWNIIAHQADSLPGGMTQIAGENPALLRMFFNDAGWNPKSADRAIQQLASSTIDSEALKELMRTTAAMNGWRAAEEVVWDDQMLQRVMETGDRSITRTTTVQGGPESLTLGVNTTEEGTPDQPVEEQINRQQVTPFGGDPVSEARKGREVEQPEQTVGEKKKDAQVRALGPDKYGRPQTAEPDADAAIAMVEANKPTEFAPEDTSGSPLEKDKVKISGYQLTGGYTVPEDVDFVKTANTYSGLKSEGNDLDKMATAVAYDLWHKKTQTDLFNDRGMATQKGMEVIEDMKKALREQNEGLFDDKGNYVDSYTLVEEVGEFRGGTIRVKDPKRMTEDMVVREVANIMGYDEDDHRRVKNAIMIVNGYTDPKDLKKTISSGGTIKLPLFDIRSPMLYSQASNTTGKYANSLLKLHEKLVVDEFGARAVQGTPGFGTAAMEGRNIKTLFSEKTRSSTPYKSFVSQTSTYMQKANEEAAEKKWRYDFSNKAEFDATLMALSGENNIQRAYGWLTGADQRQLERLAAEGQMNYYDALRKQADARAQEILKKIEMLNSGDMRGSPEMVTYMTELLKLEGIKLDNMTKSLEINELANPLNPSTTTGALFYNALDEFEKNPLTRRELRNPEKHLDGIRKPYYQIVQQFLVQYSPELFKKIDPEARTQAIVDFVSNPDITGGLRGVMRTMKATPTQQLGLESYPVEVQEALDQWLGGINQ